MEFTPYLEALHRDLAAAAAVGGEDITRAAELLTGAIDASGRLCLLEVISDAAAEITSKLSSASVEVRLRGREAQFVVSETTPEPAMTAPTTPSDVEGDITRITLRLPEGLKDAVEAAAAAQSISVNAWLVRAVTNAVATPAGPSRQPPSGRRYTGFAQA